MYILCGVGEDAGAYFLQLSAYSQLWRKVRGWLWMKHEMMSYKRMLWVFKLHYRGTSRLVKARHFAISSMIHYEWQAKNRSIFEDVHFMIYKKIQVHEYRSLDIYSNMIFHHI